MGVVTNIIDALRRIGSPTQKTALTRQDAQLGFTDEAVIELLGAMFGHYCVGRLNMRWVKLSDADGSTLAIEGVDLEFRGFPFQTISKRIADSEYGFFVPVFALMAGSAAKGRWRVRPK
jgi:hypothetical protein